MGFPLGALTGVLSRITSTALLAVGFRLASTFPQTYGPLAGIVALLLWGYLSALAIFDGSLSPPNSKANGQPAERWPHLPTIRCRSQRP